VKYAALSLSRISRGERGKLGPDRGIYAVLRQAMLNDSQPQDNERIIGEGVALLKQARHKVQGLRKLKAQSKNRSQGSRGKAVQSEKGIEAHSSRRSYLID
jgi:hypothetical protein